MEDKEKKKRPVGRPVTGSNKIRIDINLSIDINDKLNDYVAKNNSTKSSTIENCLRLFFEKL